MAKSYRLSTADLMALSGVPRAFEIFDETLGGEVKAELESFTGESVTRETQSVNELRMHRRYNVRFFLEARPRAEGREASVAAMKRIALNKDWEPYNLDNPSSWAGVRRVRNLTTLLPEEDHVAAVKHFFVESIRHPKAELTAFKKEHLDLPWDGM